MRFSKTLAAQEYSKQYADTFVKLSAPSLFGAEGGWRTGTFRVAGGDRNGLPHAHEFLAEIYTLNADGESSPAGTVDSTELEVDTTYPANGLVYIPAFAKVVMIERNAKRQWKWGLCRGNTYVWSPAVKHMRQAHRIALHEFFLPFPVSLGHMLHRDETLSGQIAYWALNREFVEPETAVTTLFRRETFNIALSRFWFLSQSPTSENLLIWHLNRVVGEIAESREISLSNDLFQQELRDFIIRQQLPWRIVGAQGA